MDHIKTYLQKLMGVMDYIDLAQDRGRRETGCGNELSGSVK
jgi:hypothetical protein